MAIAPEGRRLPASGVVAAQETNADLRAALSPAGRAGPSTLLAELDLSGR